jgi:3-phenylpropionate/trans-cinnamate dioxygenase ferredoxin reductase subunit
VALHHDNGVRFRWGTSATAVERDAGKSLVTLSSGETLEFDTFVVGIGVTPNTDLAASAGLVISNGIAVDDRLRTSAPGVFAAGDCSSFPHPLFGNTRVRLEVWRNALDQGLIAATNMLGGDESYRAVRWFWSDQYDHTLQVSGLPSLATQTVERVRPDGVSIHFGLNDEGDLVSTSAVGFGNSVAKDVKSAEVLIRESIRPTLEQLADPALPILKIRTMARAAAERTSLTVAAE